MYRKSISAGCSTTESVVTSTRSVSRGCAVCQEWNPPGWRNILELPLLSGQGYSARSQSLHIFGRSARESVLRKARRMAIIRAPFHTSWIVLSFTFPTTV
jgi:hypothetical protein